MLKASAWPYPVFETVSYSLDSVQYGDLSLASEPTAKGLVIDCLSLRDRCEGCIKMRLTINTGTNEVKKHALAKPEGANVIPGAKILCKDTKFRQFVPANQNGMVSLEMPLARLHGTVEVSVVFLSANDTIAANDVSISSGSVVGIAADAVIFTIDEDWTGENIPVDWLDFELKNLPANAFLHVELSGGSQVPRVWLNSKFRAQTEAVLLRAGENTPSAVAGAALRQFVWNSVWEKVVPWALREETADESNWPATRIAKMWRDKFAEENFTLPTPENLDAHALNDLSVHLQHLLIAGPNLSRIQRLLSLQPLTGANQ
jgi:hypothetical protein